MNYCLLFLFLFPLALFAQPTRSAELDRKDQALIQEAFNHANAYMEANQYDSAQVWLNSIYLKLSYSEPSLFSYLLTSRQAEVYYYNNLHQLGLQEALKGENIATLLKDSLLIADACNFIGLFYLNSNRPEDALRYFRKGLRHIHPPPYPPKYDDLSMPHHIYGNMAEAFEKLNQPDSAIANSRLSLLKAKEVNKDRGIAIAHLNLGMAFIHKPIIDSARKYFQLANVLSIQGDDFDVELTSFGGLAECASLAGNENLALSVLNQGFELLKKYPQLNDYFSMLFLENALQIYQKFGKQEELIHALGLKTQIQKETYERNNTQIQSILSTSLSNEKLIFNLELAESKNKQSLANTRLYLVLLVFLLCIIGFIAYRYYSLQRLRLANLRTKISQDLHDEVGATLSGIAMYSYITKEQIKKQQHQDVDASLDLIKDNAGEMVAKLNDIVWAVNPAHDSLHALLFRLKEFALQLTAAKEINLQFAIPESLGDLKLSMQERKNSYLICKEAINNAVKYSQCQRLEIEVIASQNAIQFLIKDDGKGFEKSSAIYGNGLINMEHRAQEIDAKLTIDSSPNQGTTIKLNCKIT
ncbi:tetratricopeptide repeat-containing sensor histidine kinase [Sphingobacterium hungaricum]|uniref:histidine kinase n=1 Tax=Sphingobacterium hungaricum TaxID=2082723 RepID=A0A928UX02_9SPHI|nr:histidine kinase [Sphingobacterium hungaricum]MBE8712307.1 hypothetical protein [Sphingobacterium hungaricum]